MNAFMSIKFTRITGWTTLFPNPGDIVRFRGEDEGLEHYLITKVDPCWGPDDMYHADVTLIPRELVGDVVALERKGDRRAWIKPDNKKLFC